MQKTSERFPANIHVTTSVVGDTPPPHCLNQLKTFLLRIGPRNQSPTWSADRFWELVGPTDGLAITWTYGPTCQIAARLERQEDGPCKLACGGWNHDPLERDNEPVPRDTVAFALSIGITTDLQYGPRQLLEWIGACAPGPSTAEARAVRDAQQDLISPPAHNNGHSTEAAALADLFEGWEG